ncbi:polysaccharide deacetylase family protein [Denitratisoma oestradiolicum]|uniref:Polysaccharide deacetylase n=1 Tax=Denitratisoma oestradiolicum TaxID=311182 RepID=A0A6S6XU83_9PROT|nr:polysaccharide deacetylase family protein [Denitratisoma oestradiolicum]TWO79154.1 polysaccharide deacetylase [Denitratisoma oestradiolicum]CAB1369590.1 Polysaccharide deacetylase [Denitratisoma oestradiolicum]
MKETLSYYDYQAYRGRPKIVWPNGARLAFWVAPNIEFYELNPPANPKRQPWPHPYPAVPGYSIRDYGNRVGHMRQMRLLDKYGIRGSISLSAALCQHHPEIIELCRERDWEFFSHGIYNTRYTYGMSEEEERAMILDSMETIEQAVGTKPLGYLAPALSHSEVTLDLFAELGGLYTCDLFHDDQPTPLRVRSGRQFVSVPYSLEMNDTIAYVVNKVEPRHYGQMLKDCFDRLYQEGAESGTVMCIPTHNYQVSCPHRMRAFEEALEYITGHSDVWVTTGREIARYYADQYWMDPCSNSAAAASTEITHDR